MTTISKKQQISDSRLMSFVLRHKPEALGLTLSGAGWCNTTDLIKAMKSTQGSHFTLTYLQEIMANEDKPRYKLNATKTLIRASQGHSIDIDLDLPPIEPPPVLWHGTAQKSVDAIFEQGITKRSRHHIHLSSDLKTASDVGSRHGQLVILEVDATRMFNDGFDFYQSENLVWLTDFIPSQYLRRIQTKQVY